VAWVDTENDFFDMILIIACCLIVFLCAVKN